MTEQQYFNDLRKKCRVVVACNSEWLTLKLLGEYIEVSQAAFYNFIAGYYKLSREKALKLEEYVDELLELEELV